MNTEVNVENMLRKNLDMKIEDGKLVAMASRDMSLYDAVRSLIRYYNHKFIKKNGGKRIGDGIEIIVSDGHGKEGYTLRDGEVRKVIYNATTHLHEFVPVDNRKVEIGEVIRVHHADSYKD